MSQYNTGDIQRAEQQVSTPITHEELAAIHHRKKAADRMVSDLCHGREHWIMRVPASHSDPDIVIADSLKDVPTLIAEVERLQAELLKRGGPAT